MPVSTTHVISTAIMGVGSSQRLSAVRWGVAGDIVTAWVLTIPASAVVAGLAYLLLEPRAVDIAAQAGRGSPSPSSSQRTA